MLVSIRWNSRALVAYAIGIIVEIPFMSTSFYTGPFVAPLGGADISWILGLIVSAGLYAIFGRSIARRENAWFAERDARRNAERNRQWDGQARERESAPVVE